MAILRKMIFFEKKTEEQIMSKKITMELTKYGYVTKLEEGCETTIFGAIKAINQCLKTMCYLHPELSYSGSSCEDILSHNEIAKSQHGYTKYYGHKPHFIDELSIFAVKVITVPRVQMWDIGDRRFALGTIHGVADQIAFECSDEGKPFVDFEFSSVSEMISSDSQIDPMDLFHEATDWKFVSKSEVFPNSEMPVNELYEFVFQRVCEKVTASSVGKSILDIANKNYETPIIFVSFNK